MKRKPNFDQEELEVLQAWEAGALTPVPGMAQTLKDHQGMAQASFKKDQRLNIRISSRDLKSLQAPPDLTCSEAPTPAPCGTG